MRLAVLLAGLVVPQVLLVGPALVGRKILLDLPILGEPGVYLPGTRPTRFPRRTTRCSSSSPTAST